MAFADADAALPGRVSDRSIPVLWRLRRWIGLHQLATQGARVSPEGDEGVLRRPVVHDEGKEQVVGREDTSLPDEALLVCPSQYALHVSAVAYAEGKPDQSP